MALLTHVNSLKQYIRKEKQNDMAKKEVQKKEVVQDAPAAKTTAGKEDRMPLTMQNYKLMLIGFAVIVLGLILMVGGGSDDPNQFNYEMFSFRRITLAPVLVLAGFVLEVYAIMKKTKRE